MAKSKRKCLFHHLDKSGYRCFQDFTKAPILLPSPPLPSPPPFPSRQVQCDMNSSKFARATSQYSSGLEPKRTLLIICLTCTSYQSWYFSFASFPTLTWMSFMFVNVVKSLWLFIKVKYSDYDALLLFSRLCYFRPCMRWFECLLRVFSVCLV